MSRFKSLFLILLRYYRHLGLRVSLYALLSILTAFSSPMLLGNISEDLVDLMDFSAVTPVLTILATSMLAVSTFSLNIMVTAHRAAAQATTPRVHRLLLEDTTTQSVLATFIGAFVFSLVTIVLYQARFYREETAVLVMAVTVFVVGLVIVSMLRWIQHLTNLGSVDDSLHSVVERSKEALIALANDPAMGANVLTKDIRLPTDCTPLKAPSSGFLQIVDVAGLQEFLPAKSLAYLNCRPGSHVLQGQVMAYVSGSVDDAQSEKLSEQFILGRFRTFEQDAEFGLVVLSEIACKALSPGINDPGTAIETVTHLKTLLWNFANAESREAKVSADRVFMPILGCETLCHAAFAPVARDGAGNIEVGICLRSALLDLMATKNVAMSHAACDVAALAMDYADHSELLPVEMRQLVEIDLPELQTKARRT